MGREDLVHLIIQIQALGQMVLIFSIALGIVLTICGVMLIPAAARPMNSTSWFGRQINPQMVATFFIAGAALVAIGHMIEFGGGVFMEGGFGDENPLNWHQPSSSASEFVLMGQLYKTISRVIGLAFIVHSFSTIRFLYGGQPSPNSTVSITGIAVKVAVGIGMMVPDRLAAFAASILPIFNPIANALNPAAAGFM